MIQIIHDVTTGEISQIEMSQSEIAQFQKYRNDISKAENEIQASRAALLEKLGITEEEAKLLLGGN